jgi:hypothetical protein
MSDDELLDFRMAVIAELAGGLPGGIGRTALMKCLYFLQEARDVPLGYRFGLYTYGPYDARVLQDVKLAQGRGVLSSHVVAYPNGYGYAIEPAAGAEKARTRSSGRLKGYRDALDWVRRNFAGRSATELETASTLVFVDRELAQAGRASDLAEVVARVHDIKPHLACATIKSEAWRLKVMGLLRAAA